MLESLEPVLLARIQFTFTVAFHIIFPAFTIGLGVSLWPYVVPFEITIWQAAAAMALVFGTAVWQLQHYWPIWSA